MKAVLFLGFLGAGLAIAVPAVAEYSSTPQTDWGVQTKGNSNTIGQWAALSWEVDQVDGTIFIGGNYLEVTDGTRVESQPYFAGFDAETGDFQPWFRPQVGSAVFAMQPTSDGGLLVGGEIDTWNGLQIGSLVKIDPATGELWPGWQTRAFGGNSVIRDLKLEADGWVYAVGSFSQVNEGNGPIAANGAFRFDPITGAIDQTWLPSISEGGAAWGVSRSKTQDVVYIAGFFTSVAGDDTSGGFVGLDDTGAIVQNRDDIVPYNGCRDIWPYCIQMYDVEATEAGHIWVVGVEHALYAIDEATGDLIQHHYTGCNPAFNDCLGKNWYGGEFQELERDGNRIYATCHCWTDLYSHDEVIPHADPPEEATRTTIKAIAAFDVTTTDHVTSFAPALTGDSGGFGVHINPNDGCIWVVGGFGSYGAPGGPQPPAHDVVRLCDEAGPGPAAPTTPPPAPVACTVGGDEAGAVIDWTSGPYAIATVIHRAVDGETPSWAGRVDDPGMTFNGVVAANKPNEFFVQHVYDPGQRSELISCGVLDLTPGELTAATSCVASVGPEGEAVLTWVGGENATSHVVRRSVDGGTSYWRARVEGETTFTDTLIVPGRTYAFTIFAKGADGVEAEGAPCSPDVLIELPGPGELTTCAASVLADGSIQIDWAEGANFDRYILRRSVSGGTTYWRARIDSVDPAGSAQYIDTATNPGSSYQFTVEAIGTNGSIVGPVTCDPAPIVVPAPVVAPVAACTLVDNGSSYTLTWTYQEGAPAADAIVFRSRDGGSFGWRARTADAFFEDTSVSSASTYTYQVRLLDDANVRSEPVDCL